MGRKAIFLDVDGTLTLPNGQVSPKVEEAISKVRKNGHYVFLCTGRNKAGVRALMPIGFDGIICSAGGYIEMNGDKVYESSLSQEDLQLARDVFDQHHIMYNLEATHMTFQDEEMNKEFIKHRLTDEKLNSEMIRLLNEQKDRFNIHSLEEYENNPQPIQKLCFMCDDIQKLEKPKEILSEKFNFIIHEIFSQDVINGEIIIKGTNKGNAVQFVTKKLGISLEDTIGFGDSMNDYEMIKVCHHAVVMGNGVKELKQYASSICESVEDDGIYHELKRLGLLS
ncbi:Cof-type HAD-IIB family hydrolase [Longibaculum muris]|uniref:Cof-type HAD-IIB family hydrolase n=1 Tax=Longibaculum muris TaxID=1796628 RepID=UPI0022E93625|nr:HAD family hydrolase [Longibaculum muris]